MTLPERLLDLGRGSCDRRRRRAPMLSLGEGASPTQLPVRTGGGRRFGDRAGAGASRSCARGVVFEAAVGPDWARCGSTGARPPFCFPGGGGSSASRRRRGAAWNAWRHTAGLPLVTAPRRRVGLSVWASVADRDPLRAYCPAIVGLGAEEWLQVAAAPVFASALRDASSKALA